MPSPPLLFEMMRSFVSLARTLNLSHTVKELNSTRQTVRRHIATLEECMGGPLFIIEDRKYQLTELGQHSLAEADELVMRSEAWLNRTSTYVNGLHRLNLELGDGHPYYLQQHPISRLWQDSSPLLREGMRAWANSEGDIEALEFAVLRPYLLVFRHLDTGWICVEVGEKSSYASWFGWAWQRSSVGREVSSLPGGEEFGPLLTVPFEEVHDCGGARLDHIYTLVPRLVDGKPVEMVPISYQRLLMACHFPDGSFALASLIDRTWEIEIDGLAREVVCSMPKELIMNVDIAAELAGSTP